MTSVVKIAMDIVASYNGKYFASIEQMPNELILAKELLDIIDNCVDPRTYAKKYETIIKTCV
jgi:hypothetical protein